MHVTSSLFGHTCGSFLRVGDADLYYELLGDSAKPPLLLLHGGLGNITDFNPIADQLLDDFYLVGLDTRGHGRSSLGSAPLTYEQCEAEVIALLRHLAVDNFSVLGFSVGGVVGYRLAANPEVRASSLVALGAQWRLNEADEAFSMLSGLTPDMWDAMFPTSRPYYESVNPSPDFARLVTHAVGLWTDLKPSSYPGDRVRNIAIPTLLVRGDSDPLFSLVEATALQAKLPAASLLNVPFAGHEVHVESPELFMAVVRRFLLRPRHRATEA